MASDGRNNRILYHFPSYSRLLDMEDKVIQDYAADKLQGPNGSYVNFGEYIHADEDTFAHSTMQGYRDFHYYGDGIRGNGGTLGHARQGHRNDHTWTDVDKGMAMALQLYNDMQFAPIGRPRQPWSAINRKIRDFMEYKPNVYWQSYGPFRVENVTFKGYTTKIQKLDSSYTIQPYDVYSKVFSDVEGFQGKDVGLQLKPQVSTGLGIGIGILVLSPIGL